MLSRRDLVGKLGAGVAAVCVAGAARAGFASVRGRASTTGGTSSADDLAAPRRSNADRPTVADAAQSATIEAPAPWELVRPLAMGSVVAHGWRVAGLTGAVEGSCVLTLQNERGRSHRVHVCRNDGRPQGLVYTDHFDLVVMNGGEGDLPTEEGFAQAVAEVAHILAANESPRQPVVTALMPHAERVRLFAGPTDPRLR